MNYLILFEGKTPFNKLWDLRAELDLRLTNVFFSFEFCWSKVVLFHFHLWAVHKVHYRKKVGKGFASALHQGSIS